MGVLPNARYVGASTHVVPRGLMIPAQAEQAIHVYWTVLGRKLARLAVKDCRNLGCAVRSSVRQSTAAIPHKEWLPPTLRAHNDRVRCDEPNRHET